MTGPTRADLDFTYQMALTILFRLLFVAYAEDKGLLPYRSNEDYRARSLNQRARKLLAMEQRRTPLESGPFMWQEVQLLFDAVDQGHHDWGIPPYNGGLFESGRDKSPVGAAIRQISLGDDQFGLVLRALLLDYEQRDDIHGPVDFRSLSVREFGTIYEGLLQSELSVAQNRSRVGPRWPLRARQKGAGRRRSRRRDLPPRRLRQPQVHRLLLHQKLRRRTPPRSRPRTRAG